MPDPHQRAAELVRTLPADVVLKAAGLCNGHDILDPQAFLDAGLPLDVIRRVTTTHKSDGTHKGSIYVDGKQVDQLSGVYGLDMLEFIAGALGLKYRRYMGRGFQASAIKEALRCHFHDSTT